MLIARQGDAEASAIVGWARVLSSHKSTFSNRSDSLIKCHIVMIIYSFFLFF